MIGTQMLIGIALRILLVLLGFTTLALRAEAEFGAIEPIETVGSFEISIETDRSLATLQVATDEDTTTYHFDIEDVRIADRQVRLSSDLRITRKGLLVGERLFPLDNLRVLGSPRETRGRIEVVLKHFAGGETSHSARRGRVVVGRDLMIDEDDLVRGDVIVFGGDAEIEGEVTRNVIACFGNVRVQGSKAIVRKDVVAIDGTVRFRGNPTVRGEVLATRGTRGGWSTRRGYHYSTGLDADLEGLASYNRVDGLYLGLLWNFKGHAEILPKVTLGGGYAFELERWRYKLGIAQKLCDSRVTLGGHYFRETATDDDWLSGNLENSVLVLVGGVDYRDYYEEEGAEGYVLINPTEDHELGCAYRFTELTWLDANPKLWSLFEAEGDFRENFSSVDPAVRAEARQQFDSDLGQLTAWYMLGSIDEEGEAEPLNGWWGRLEYQTAGRDLKGGFCFDRFTAELRCYQHLSKDQDFNVRVKYGISDGDLPLFRSFFLGGMRTVRGLEHKLRRGEQMILANAEYAFGMHHDGPDMALLFDVGKVAAAADDIFAEEGYTSSIGLRLGIDEGIQVEVAKSLDTGDADERFWVTLKRSF